MAHLRRTSRRNTAVNDDVTSQITEPEPVGLNANGEHVEKDGDVVMHDNEPSEATAKEAVTFDGDMDDLEMEMDPEKLKVEEALWESFREEFHEVIEQLPLYLHRHFTLMRDLDEQSFQHSTDLMSDIHRYIDLRSKLAGVSMKAPVETAAPGGSATQPLAQPPNDAESQHADPMANSANVNAHTQLQDGAEATAVASPSNGFVPSPSEKQVRQLVDGLNEEQSAPHALGDDVFDEAPVPWNATRTLLPRIGWLTDEIRRTSDEKHHLAKTIYNMIQRHVRQLDHSIKEQENANDMGTGAHKGTHPMMLQDLTAPRWHRQAQSTIPADDDEETPEPVQDDISKTPAKKRRGRPPAASTAQATPNGARTGLKFTLKRPPLGQGQSSSQADGAGEELYCICQRPSSGIMVLCDNDNCQNGSWFHLECLGMKETPSDEAPWYCPKCEARPLKATKRKRR